MIQAPLSRYTLEAGPVQRPIEMSYLTQASRMIWSTLPADLETWFSIFPKLPKSLISIWTFHSSTAYIPKNTQAIRDNLTNLYKWAHPITSPTQRNSIPVPPKLPLCPLLVTTSLRVIKGSVSVYVCVWPLSVNVNFLANHPRDCFHSSSLLGHSPLSESDSVHSLPLLLMGMFVPSIRGYLWNRSARNLLMHVFWWPSVCITVKNRPIAGSYGKCSSHLLEIVSFFKVPASFCIPIGYVWEFLLDHLLVHSGYFPSFSF